MCPRSRSLIAENGACGSRACLRPARTEGAGTGAGDMRRLRADRATDRRTGARRSGGRRRRVGEARPAREFLGERDEVRVRAAPVDLGKAQVEVAERAAGRDVGERIALAVAPRALAQLLRELDHAAVDLRALARDPLFALLPRRPLALEEDRARRVADPVGERLPALDRDALPRRLRDEAAHRARAVQVFDDDPRIEEPRAVVEDE